MIYLYLTFGGQEAFYWLQKYYLFITVCKCPISEISLPLCISVKCLIVVLK